MSEGTGHLFHELDIPEGKFAPINAKYKSKNPERDSEIGHYTQVPSSLIDLKRSNI